MIALRIGDRVRSRATGGLGTVVATPYWFRGQLRFGVAWDDRAGWFAHYVSFVDLVSGASVPPEARPVSVGAMAGGGR